MINFRATPPLDIEKRVHIMYASTGYVRVSEIARRCGVPVIRVHRWIKSGLPAFRLKNGRGIWRGIDKHVAHWLAGNPELSRYEMRFRFSNPALVESGAMSGGEVQAELWVLDSLALKKKRETKRQRRKFKIDLIDSALPHIEHRRNGKDYLHAGLSVVQGETGQKKCVYDLKTKAERLKFIGGHYIKFLHNGETLRRLIYSLPDKYRRNFLCRLKIGINVYKCTDCRDESLISKRYEGPTACYGKYYSAKKECRYCDLREYCSDAGDKKELVLPYNENMLQ